MIWEPHWSEMRMCDNYNNRGATLFLNEIQTRSKYIVDRTLNQSYNICRSNVLKRPQADGILTIHKKINSKNGDGIIEYE